MTSEVFRWVGLSTLASTLITLVYFFIYRKRQPKPNRILAISLFVSFTFDVIGWALMYNKRSTVFSNNLYCIVAFPAIMLFYHETLIKTSLKILVRVFTLIFLILAMFFAIDQGLDVVNFNTMVLSSILITITSFFFVADLKLMDESTFESNHYHEINIILNTSLALYYFATIVLFSMWEYILSNFTAEDARYFWTLHNVVHILKNAGITVAFYLTAKRSLELTNFQKSKEHKH